MSWSGSRFLLRFLHIFVLFLCYWCVFWRFFLAIFLNIFIYRLLRVNCFQLYYFFVDICCNAGFTRSVYIPSYLYFCLCSLSSFIYLLFDLTIANSFPLSGNRVAPCEKTYVFMPSNDNYTDGSNDLALQYSENRGSRSILQEITKLSQMNISRLNAKCSYSVLVGCPTDSTESLLKQHSTQPGAEIEGEDVLIATPTRGKKFGNFWLYLFYSSLCLLVVFSLFSFSSPFYITDEVFLVFLP